MLVDVINTMLAPSFIQEVFRPQDLYSLPSTRKVFEKLAHSSIMKLNATSMGKLFDLMLMGIKYQVLSMTSAEEVYFITMKHLNTMTEMISDDACKK